MSGLTEDLFLSHHTVYYQENGTESSLLGEESLELRCCKAW